MLLFCSICICDKILKMGILNGKNCGSIEVRSFAIADLPTATKDISKQEEDLGEDLEIALYNIICVFYLKTNKQTNKKTRKMIFLYILTFCERSRRLHKAKSSDTEPWKLGVIWQMYCDSWQDGQPQLHCVHTIDVNTACKQRLASPTLLTPAPSTNLA